MKKIRLTLLMLMAFMMSLALQAQQTIDFESGDLSQFTNDETYPWEVTTVKNHTEGGSQCIKSTNEGVNSSTSSIELTTSFFDAPGLISFYCWASCESATSYWDYGIFYIDGVQQNRYLNVTSWQAQSFEVPAGTHTFKWTFSKDGSSAGNDDCFYLDDIVMSILSCPTPTELAYSDVTATSAVLSWTAGGSEPKWTLEVSDGETTYPIPDITENPYTLEGLTSATTYTVKVKANCTDEDASEWSNTVTFTTPCVTEVVTSSWVENFSNGAACWTLNEYVSGTTAWTIATTLSNNGDVSSLYDGACAKFYVGNRTSITKLVSPVLDLTALGSSAQLSFQMANADWSGDINTMKVYYRTSAASEWVEIAYYEGTHVEWELQTLILPNTSATYQIAFEGIADYGYAIFLDDITVSAPPACAAPSLSPVTNLTSTSATISWTANSGEMEWTLEVSEGDNIYTIPEITENSYPLAGLTPATNYSVRVKANCSEESSSDWSTAITFTTECAAVASLEEGFESYTSGLPICWDKVGAGTIAVQTSQPNSGTKSLKFSGVTNGNIVALPVLESYDGMTLTFYTKPESNNSSCGTFAVGYITDISDATTFTAIETYNYNDFSVYTQKEIELSNVPANARLAFNHMAGATYYYWFVDDINIDATPTCLKPTDVTISDITTTSATIAWTDNNTTAPQGWTIELNGTTEVAAATNPYTLEDLTVATIYTVRVKANCTDEDMSDWSNEVTFATECDAVAAAGYVEDFSAYPSSEISSVGELPTCWDAIYSGSDNSYAPHVSHAGYYLEMNDNFFSMLAGSASSGNPNYAIMPVLEGLNGMTISFNYLYESTSYGTLSFGYITDIADSTTFTAIGTLDASTEIAPAEYELANIPQGARLAFKWYVNGAYSWYSCGIDDITITGEAPVDTCSTPTNVAVENGVVTWNGDAANYNVYIVSGEDVVVDTIVSTTSYTIQGLNEGDHATVTVQAICDEDNLSDWSEAVEFDYTTIGINSHSINANIFPNPTTGNVTVESNAINADITVYDMFGKLMMTSKVAADRTELNFSGFATGVYIIDMAPLSSAATSFGIIAGNLIRFFTLQSQEEEPAEE